MRLSAVLIVRDEQDALPDCLASLADRVAEIVVVDTGSVDRTVDIARSFGAKIEHFPWCDDFSAARNYALGFATGDWILSIDADERLLTPIADLSSDVSGYYVTVIADDSLRYLTPRLFRNRPEIRFSGVIHEMPATEFGRWETRSDIALQHTGYTQEKIAAKDKWERNLKLLDKQIARDPADPFAYFNKAAVLNVLGRHVEAQECARQAILLWLPAKRNTGYVGQMFRALSQALGGQGRYEEALEAAKRGLKHSADPELVFEYGACLIRVGNWQEALGPLCGARRIAQQALDGEIHLAAFDPALADYRTDAAVATCLLETGNPTAARLHAIRALESADHPGLHALLERCEAKLKGELCEVT